MSKSTVLITGATGFIGRHAVRSLMESGRHVRALCRSDAEDLVAEGVEVVHGDILDAASIEAALEGVDEVVHAAGGVSRDDDDSSWMMQVHIVGTRHVVGAAARAGVRRVVHLSTSGTVAVGEEDDVVFHEDDPVPLELIHRWPYYLSKWLAERAAFDAVKHDGDGKTELVVLNPSLALGPGDDRGSSTTDVKRFLERQIPVVPSGGFSFVDARDIADAIVLALDNGRAGQRYLLGATNLTVADFFGRLSEVSGVRGPLLNVKLPRPLTRLGVGLLERAAEAIGAKPPVSSEDADMSSHFWYVDARKAEDELGWKPREPMDTLLDTVKDLRGEYRSEKFIGRG
jgi:dihydroflavonol-4-reductase